MTESVGCDISTARIEKSPIDLLREYAHLLDSFSGGYLHGEVISQDAHGRLIPGLIIVVPAADWNFAIAEARYSPVSPYPATLKGFIPGDFECECRDPVEFNTNLVRILTCEYVRQTLHMYISMSAEEDS